jgi:hypothetical protein
VQWSVMYCYKLAKDPGSLFPKQTKLWLLFPSKFTPRCHRANGIWPTSAPRLPQPFIIQFNSSCNPFSLSNCLLVSIAMTSSQPQLPPKWQLVAWQKKDEQYARIPSDWRIPHDQLPAPKATNYLSIPSTCGILSNEELRITEKYDATALAEAIKSRKLKSVDVARAFCKVCQLLGGIYFYRCNIMNANARYREPL